MRTRTKVLLGVVGAIIVGYPATAWLAGIGVESQLQRNEQRLLDDSNYLVLIRRDYHRGIYGATEVLTYGIGGPMVGLNATPAGRMLASLRLTVRNTIHHGPFPGLRAFGLASVDSQLQIDTRAAAAGPGGEADSASASQPIVQIHTVIGWIGNSRATFQSPAMHYRTADGTLFDWRGIRGTLLAGRNMNTWSGTFAAPGFDLQGPNGRIAIGGLSFSAHRRLVYDAFYIGDSQFSLASVQYLPVGGNPLQIQGFSVQGISAPSPGDAQYVDTTGDITADSIQSARFSATRVGYDLGFSHVHGPSLAALTLALRDMRRNAAGSVDLRSRMLDAIREYGPDIALHDPVFTIRRLGFVTPEGELRLSGRLALPGLKRENLPGPNALITLVRYLQASIDVHADTALADKLLGTAAQGAAAAAQLQQFEHQGYIKREGGTYVMHIDYRSGKLTINGLPYPPASSPSS